VETRRESEVKGTIIGSFLTAQEIRSATQINVCVSVCYLLVCTYNTHRIVRQCTKRTNYGILL